MSINLPSTTPEWEFFADKARDTLWKLLGDLPPLFMPKPTISEREQRGGGFAIEKIEFDNEAGATVYGYLLIPDGLQQPAPAVLYHHMHGAKYDLGKDELWQDWLIGVAPGPALAKAGFVVLAIDAYSFNQRTTQGPAGERERGLETEQALFKKFVWEGKTLWGMIVRDDLLALDYLLSRPEVDPQRVGVTGMSLGGSRTTWLAALDPRVKAVIPVAQMTRYADFAAAGNYNLHSIYYYVPSFLKSGLDMEILTSLVAPRAQMILIGEEDPLSPIAGVHKIIDYTRQVYRLYGAEDRFVTGLYPGMAHKYTVPMFERMVDFLKERL